MDNNRRVVELPLDDVLPNRFQPRIKFNEEAINELAESIKEHGLIQPIVVRAVGDRYEIIAGERRYKAATLAGLQTIPAIITDLNDKDSAEVALIENVQRQDLTPIEEAISYKKILDMGYLTQDNLAQKLGKNQSTVANKLRLLNLDEDVQEALLNGKISERHARSLLKLTNTEDQVKLLHKIINERLTVRKTDEEINKMLNEENKIRDIEVLDVEEPVIIPTEDISHFNIPMAPIIEDNSTDEESGDDTQNIINPFISMGNENIQMAEEVIPKFNDLLSTDKNEVELPVFEDLLNNQEPEIAPGKFFNILEETPLTTEEKTQEFDFNNLFEDKVIEQPKEELDAFSNLSNFGMPDIEDSSFNASKELELPSTPALEVNPTNTFVASDIKTVINTIRNCAETIEKYGFVVDTEEFDLEDMYQVIFKVHKK